MEPRYWKWIQGVVIVAAAALGIGLAVWYGGRPVDTTIPALAYAPRTKKTLRSARPDVIPSVFPAKTASGSTMTVAPDVTGAAVPVPSQSPVNAWQKAAVDPSVHLNIPAPAPSVIPYATPTGPPVSTGSLPGGPPGSVPAPYTPSSPGNLPGSPSPASVPATSPFGGPAPTEAGGGGVPSSSGASGTPPVATGSGAGSPGPTTGF